MRELTPGEMRYIYESTNGWRMHIYSQSQNLTKEDEERMDELEQAYREAFYAYYEAALKRRKFKIQTLLIENSKKFMKRNILNFLKKYRYFHSPVGNNHV